MKRTCCYLLSLFWLVSTSAAAAADTGPADARPVAYFQQVIRPLLIEACLKCHGPEKKKGDLDLSRRETVLEGGSNGPALVAGQSEQSLLFQKVSAGKMPPGKPLPPEQVAAFKKWIDAGAAFDREPLLQAKKAALVAPWSFQPLGRPAVPSSKYDALAHNVIDRFLLAALEKKGLAPSPPAERLALLRRVTFDLTGLPPTREEVRDFLADSSADAYEKVVSRLLASTAHGERWARHWLDVVRFGESHGYEQNHIRPSAWPYRDYVIRSFNEDKPFDRFIHEQLAGDVLADGDPAVEAATGFLVAGVHDTVGNKAEEGRRQQRANDLEDIVSTVGAAFLGLTVGCAKCHDHKFDPIPQRDFYRLTAVFAGVRHEERQPKSRKLTPQEELVEKDERRRLRELTGRLQDIQAAAYARLFAPAGGKGLKRPPTSAGRNVEDFPPTPARFVRFTILATRDGTAPCLDELQIFGADGKDNLALASGGAKATASSLLTGYRIHQIAHLNDGKFGNDWSWISHERGRGWVQIELPRNATIARIVWSRDATVPPRYQDRVASRYTLEVSLDGKSWQQVGSGADRLDAATPLPAEVLEEALTGEERRQKNQLLEELRLIQGQTAARWQSPYQAHFGAPDEIHILKRGDVMQRGDTVGPAGLSQLPGVSGELGDEATHSESTRRLALAHWLTAPNNPLTARVMVNRIWQHHFGRGLVDTPSDFGNNGAIPSHPELLDWLTRDFMAGGWRLKRLHYQMVTSHAYRQTSHTSPKGAEMDADNQFVWRMPLRRLEAEALRDSILAVSGKLDRRMGGPSFLLTKYRVVNVAIYEPLEEQGPDTWRRGIYALNARAQRDPLLASFDCPECAQRTPRRDVTTTPLQALSLFNSAFSMEQARFFEERVEKEAGAQVDRRVGLAFELAFGRAPTVAELQAATALVKGQGLAALCRALLNANEFLYY